MKQNTSANNNAIVKLLQIMSMLRDKSHGCPWDLKQTIASLATYTLEEVYEVVDAIEQGDMVELRDELGDLLFQVVFYAQIAAEEGQFNFDDIANAISDKLLRRHPHVFPDGSMDKFGEPNGLTAEDVAVNWEAIKQAEREAKLKAKGLTEAQPQSGALDDVPQAMPALERARKLQNRAARVGFDWTEVEPVLAKLKEEISEFEAAMQSEGQSRMAQELGDILFAVVNVARHCNIEPETALRAANRRFERRFRWIESTLRERGQQTIDVDLAELDALWNAAKQSGL